MAGFVFVALGIGAMSVFVWFLVQVSKRQHERLQRALRAVAQATGGSFDPGKAGLIGHRYPQVSLERDGTHLVLDLYTVNHGKSQSYYTRVRTSYALGTGPKLHIRLERILHGIGRAFGMEDLTIGHPEFDQAFMVAGPSPAAVRRVLSGSARRQMLTLLRQWSLRATDGAIELQRNGLCELSEELLAAVEVVLAVALAEKKLLTLLAAAIPDARVGPARRSVTMTLRGVEGTFRLGERGCSLSVPCAAAAPPFAVRCDAPEEARALPEGALDPGALALLGSVGPARLSREETHAWVTWGDAPAPAEVEAAWRLLVGLAAPSTSVGAFR